MQAVERKNQKTIIRLLPALLLATTGLAFFVLRNTSPWGWPSLDMATYYVNIDKNQFIINDFFTSCFGQSNGRSIFGALTAWPIYLGLTWDKTLYFWMQINSALMPFALYLGISSIVPYKNARISLTIFLFIACAIFFPGRVNQLSVAWWSGWNYNFHPSTFSITIISLGAYFLDSQKNTSNAVGCLLTFLAALVHPAFALGGGIFFSAIMLFRSDRIKIILLFLISLLAALVFIKFFTAAGALDALTYYKYFIWLHPEHYIPSHFIALGKFEWYRPVIIVSLLLIASSLLLYVFKRRVIALLPMLFLLIYISSLVTQQFFVDQYPIVSAILLISPVRFMAFGYWMLAVSIALAFSATFKFRSIPFLNRVQNCNYERFVKPVSATAISLMVATMVSFSYLGFSRVKPPEEYIQGDKKTLISWIKESTRPQDVIASSGFLSIEIPLLTGRGTYHGNGFPFEERCLIENYIRHVNIKGDPTGPSGRMESAKFFNTLDIQHFSHIQPKPNWVIMERLSLGARHSRATLTPSFENQSYVAFKVQQPETEK